MNAGHEHEYCIGLSTFSDVETARTVARKLVENGIVACANIVPSLHSIYRWKGNVEEGEEVLAVFKLTAARWEDFMNRLRELHPYELPEIIRLNVAGGLPDYLRWIGQSCDR